MCLSLSLSHTSTGSHTHTHTLTHMHTTHTVHTQTPHTHIHRSKSKTCALKQEAPGSQLTSALSSSLGTLSVVSLSVQKEKQRYSCCSSYFGDSGSILKTHASTSEIRNCTHPLPPLREVKHFQVGQARVHSGSLRGPLRAEEGLWS